VALGADAKRLLAKEGGTAHVKVGSQEGFIALNLLK
jgi:hypothetical protein